MWPDNRILDLFGIEVPILQAPMAGSSGAELAVAVSCPAPCSGPNGSVPSSARSASGPIGR
jgi:nitronate monooxygenase